MLADLGMNFDHNLKPIKFNRNKNNICYDIQPKTKPDSKTTCQTAQLFTENNTQTNLIVVVVMHNNNNEICQRVIFFLPCCHHI